MSDHVERESASGAYGAPEPSTCQAVSERADEHLAVIDELVRDLQATTVKYRHRPLDWCDVAFLSQFRDQLGSVVKGFNSAETAATMPRAARQVATDLLRFRQVDRAHR